MSRAIEVAQSPRIAVFTHDTFGLGHVRRCLHILTALAERSPDAALMLVTGSAALPVLGSLPANADLVKLPTIVRTGKSGAQPPHLPIPLKAVTSIRRALIEAAILSFRPDIFLVDNFPLGARRELLPALSALRKSGGRAVVGIRDIVGSPDTVRAEWTRDGVFEVLEKHYERIFVYGPEGVCDVAEAYAMPEAVAGKIEYCGYVGPVVPRIADRAGVASELGLSRPYVMVTVGGGGDGLPLIAAFLQAMRAHPGHDGLVVTGPLMGPSERELLEREAATHPQIRMVEYLPDLPRYMAAADAVVAMGGYNTLAEIAVQRCRAVVVPRTWRYGEHANRACAATEGEQLLRAQGLAQRGLVEFLHPDDLNPEALAAKIGCALTRGPLPEASIMTTGAYRAAERLLRMIAEAKSGAPS